MTYDEKVSITISIAKMYRDRLRIMAAERNFENPNQITSASTIAREIVCEYLDNEPVEPTSSLKGGCVK
jgi:hypothetical protein